MEKQANQLDLAQLITIEDTCACFNLRKASRAVTQLFDEKLEPSGLLVTQLTILVAISILGSVTISDLAEGLVMDRTTLTRNLKPPEREGLIQINPGDDRRVRVVTLTDKGRSVLAQALPLWQQAQTHIVESLGQERFNLLLSSLTTTVSIARNS
ncbi:MarR family winged helix-turn-helix transcriptional regulator [Nostoc sp. CHAB 5784]|uniref:MarR family winged helix-turn-helix transcriptional regulator n=1 Tax=Nostoc mirabile TaxID=2907820 RepID=UPI001E624ED2|nr:MarR family winged helix-turn-helix transcriptional regulator [Nostoc mirabile]MCC5667054.1 MarR family winged helix-turn-helix transcriptional regulator [Nostoc mirabile CHAB5784]